MTFRSGLVLAGILALGIGAYWGTPRIYRLAKSIRLSGLAVSAFQKGDREQAIAFAESTLRLNPEDDEALRVVALTLLHQRHPESIVWLARWVEQKPDEAARLSMLGNGALLMNNPSVASAALGALKKIPGARPEEILALESALLVKQGKSALALELYEQATQRSASGLPPLMRLNFANLLLASNTEADRLRGLDMLSQLASLPETRRGALRARVMQGMALRDNALIFPAADELATKGQASTDDLLLWGSAYLQVHRTLPQDFFVRLNEAVGNNAVAFDVALRWTMSNQLWDQGLAWVEQLLAQRPGDIYVCRARAAFLAAKGNWAEMRLWLEDGEWPRADPQRLIYELECLRRAGRTDASQRLLLQQLQSSLKKNPVSLLSCDRLAVALGWHKERIPLWDAVAEDRATLPEMGLKRELRQALKARDTVRLYGLSRLLLTHRSDDRLFINNGVTYSLLLDHHIVESARLAEENHAAHPDDKALITTLALARIKQNRAGEAVALFESFSPDELRQPAYAAYYAMALRAAGQNQKAVAYTALADPNRLLPEERQLAGLPPR